MSDAACIALVFFLGLLIGLGLKGDVVLRACIAGEQLEIQQSVIECKVLSIRGMEVAHD